jgi:putative PEP-CTERM system TPR-repeat lipoprotein
MSLHSVFSRAVRAAAVAGSAVLLLACGQPGPAKLIASAKDYVAKGDHPAAIIQLKNALQQAPDNGEAWLMLGQSSLAIRDFAAADKELRRALELNQSAEVVLPQLARALSELGQAETLVKDFGTRSLSRPEAQATFQTLLGEAYARRNDKAAAQRAYAAALAAKGDYAPAALGLATLAAIDGRTDEALAQVEGVVAAAPKLAQGQALKGELLLVKGDREGGRKALEAAVEADPAYLPARMTLVSLLTDEKDFDAAAKLLQDGRKISPRDLRFDYLEATLAFRKGDVERARELIQQVLKYLPEHVPSMVLAGAIDLRSGQLPSAEINLRKAVARMPSHEGARQLLVQTYLRMGQPPKARDTLQPLLEKGMPQHPTLLLLAGETYLANGDAKQATVFYQAASAAGQAQGSAARTRLGQIAMATGRADEGFKELEAAAELDAGQYQADLAIIAGHLRRNETDKAMQAVKALEKKQPNNPLTFQMYGAVNLARKDVPAARRSFEKALEMQPNYMPAAFNLAMLDLAEKKPDDARKRYEAMIAKDSKNDQLYLALADLQLRTGAKPTEVAASLQRAVNANPQSVPARVTLIAFHLRNRDNKAALTAAQSAVAAMPSDPRILDATAAAQEAAGDVNQATETLNRLAGLQPESPAPLMRLAGLYVRQKDPNKAIDVLKRAKALAGNPREIAPQLAQVYLSANRADDALKEARDLQKADPKYAGGYALEADIYAAQRKNADAERLYREALKLEPKADRVLISLHRLLADAGRATEADALVSKWMAENPKNLTVRLHLAERAMVGKNLKAAATQYQAIIAIDGSNALALNNLAWISGELGDPKAIGYAERALKLAPNNAAILDTYGMLLVKQGQADRGLEHLGRAAQLAPGRYDIRFNYARALAASGRKSDARKELEALQALPEDFPGKSEIAAMLKAL